MALKFDITSAPPSLADITCRARTSRERSRHHTKKNIGFLVFAIVIVVSILSFQLLVAVPAVRDPDSEPGIVGVVALYTPYIISFIFFVTNTLHHKIIEKPRKVLDTTIAALKEVTPEQLSDVAASEQHNVEIASYREKIAARGRSLLRAEIDAIQRWLDARKPAG